MPYDTNEWDERYRQAGYWAGKEPADFLREVLPLLPRGGTALDLASGEGRNAVFLAQQGFQVVAVERALAGLVKTEALAGERGVACHWITELGESRRHEAPLKLLQADLESFTLPTEKFDLVLCFKYLQRPLLPLLPRALRRHGMLVYETYTIEQLKFAEGPRRAEFLLQPGELRAAFSAMEILFYSEICAEKGNASLLARKHQGMRWRKQRR